MIGAMFPSATWGSTATCWLPRRDRSRLCPSVRAILPVGASLLPRALEFAPGRGSECPGFHAGLVSTAQFDDSTQAIGERLTSAAPAEVFFHFDPLSLIHISEPT